jgi:deazaflavin-dependent oxidoreductase (nitroreductase family)
MPATGTSQWPASTVTRAAVTLLLVRWLARAPIRLYQARLGFVLGSRFLMLERMGRKSGLKRYAVLEVVCHPSPSRYVVASGFGTRAQWFRNVQANPTVRVYLRSTKPVSAAARLLPPDEASAALAHYKTRHPKAWAKAKPVFEATLGATIDQMPVVALDLHPTTAPRPRRTPQRHKPGQERHKPGQGGTSWPCSGAQAAAACCEHRT